MTHSRLTFPALTLALAATHAHAQRDFAPIMHAVSIPNIPVAHPSLPAKNATDLAAVARARPGQILYGSGGYGTNNHLVLELDKIHRDASAILKMPEVRDRHTADGANVVAGNGKQFAAFIKSETVKWAKVVRAAGIVPE